MKKSLIIIMKPSIYITAIKQYELSESISTFPAIFHHRQRSINTSLSILSSRFVQSPSCKEQSELSSQQGQAKM